MKILIYSPVFYPNVGGLETIVSILAHEFVRQGHEVKLVCQTKADNCKSFPFEVVRGCSHAQLFRLAQWSEIYFQANVSLKGIWPALITRKPLVISHNGWYSRPDGRIGWQDHLKQRVARLSHNISVSSAVANHLSSRSIVVPNAYRDDIFHLMPEVPRTKQLVFLGRLVSDKGADLLLDALAALREQKLQPRLTIIGTGPEENNLRQQAKSTGVYDQIEFKGLKTGVELTRILNEHQIMVVPSRWEEPFGIVALEGIACGCVIVGSQGGGLKDAIGPCGLTVPNRNVPALTYALADILLDERKQIECRSHAKGHLIRHRQEVVARAYLDFFETILGQTLRSSSQSK